MATSPAPAIDAPLSTLTMGAAHDLRNLLFVIRAHCDQLMEGVASDDARRADLEAILDAVDRGATLTTQLVSAGRTSGRPQPADVADTIRKLEPLVRRLLGDRIVLTMRVPPTTWRVTANSVQIEQVVMNLVVNARDAMPDGGCLTIATENRTLGGVSAVQPAEFVVISVTDTGAGIAPAIQHRIFEPYFTTKGKEGTGVGLPTVRAIALLNGGHVEMITSPDAGTTMRVVLPRAAGVPLRVVHPVAPVASGPVARRRVLVIENEHAIREYAQRSLAAEGYEVSVAGSAAEALGFCEPQLPPADVVVTDVHLPDLAGPAVASRLQAVWPDVRLVFMSGDGQWLGQAGDPGGARLLAKPFTAAELVSAVRTVLSADHPV